MAKREVWVSCKIDHINCFCFSGVLVHHMKKKFWQQCFVMPYFFVVDTLSIKIIYILCRIFLSSLVNCRILPLLWVQAEYSTDNWWIW